jgi:hypothetical protein
MPQQTFWHVYGSMITTALIVYFSLPAAVTAGAFRREVAGGQLDSLSTLPGVRCAVLCCAALCLSEHCRGAISLTYYQIIPYIYVRDSSNTQCGWLVSVWGVLVDFFFFSVLSVLPRSAEQHECHRASVQSTAVWPLSRYPMAQPTATLLPLTQSLVHSGRGCVYVDITFNTH